MTLIPLTFKTMNHKGVSTALHNIGGSSGISKIREEIPDINSNAR